MKGGRRSKTHRKQGFQLMRKTNLKPANRPTPTARRNRPSGMKSAGSARPNHPQDPYCPTQKGRLATNDNANSNGRRTDLRRDRPPLPGSRRNCQPTDPLRNRNQQKNRLRMNEAAGTRRKRTTRKSPWIKNLLRSNRRLLRVHLHNQVG